MPAVTAATLQESAPEVASAASPAGSPLGSPVNPPSSAHAVERFAPGKLLAGGRYRIIGLLGKGGMGEVYRADDLRLGQPLALKFLPERWAQDPTALGRLLDEVRIARHVSHPNVCRVYDVVEVAPEAGTAPVNFITMEFVDGEDLASLLRRIGRLPQGKAVQVARELCAGLAAAHERGVLHRDLKPANIMIDGRGHARIMDFGLAGIGPGPGGAGTFRAGTPAYMAPEHLAEGRVSVQSDVYALGLVMYELFTGESVFAGRTIPEIRREHELGHSPRASRVMPDIDPTVERVIGLCLEKDPAQRPASALAVASALPGADLLSAVVAAGETPSPELLAAARERRGMGPIAATVCLGLALALMAVVAAMNDARAVFRLAPMDKPPEVLIERAREVVQAMGYAAPPLDSMSGFRTEEEYLDDRLEHGLASEVWARLESARPPAISFWYRQGPRYIDAVLAQELVTLDEPVMVDPGALGVRMDTRGRLVEFRAIPPERGPAERAAGDAPEAPGWPVLFAAAGLEQGAFVEAEPVGLAPVPIDRRLAWTIKPEEADRAGLPPYLRIEGGQREGRPVYFMVAGPWNKAAETPDVAEERASAQRTMWALILIGIPVLLAPVIGAFVLARRNLRAGRGDRRGAGRVAVFVLAAEMVWWALWCDHTTAAGDLDRAIMALGNAVLGAGLVWLCYIALEPIARRRWPRTLISWSRLMAGRWRDPLVGRDVLLGIVGGAAWMVMAAGADFVAEWRTGTRLLPRTIDPALLNPWRAIGMLADLVVVGVALPMLAMVPLLLLRGEKTGAMRWVGIAGFWLLAAILGFFYWALLVQESGARTLEYSTYEHFVVGVVSSLATFFALWRLGMLATIAGYGAAWILITMPVTLRMGEWSGTSSMLALGAVAAAAGFAFWNVMAGREVGRV